MVKKSMFQAAHRIFAFLALTLFATYGACNTLTLGIVPQQSAKKLAETWQPLINYISEHANIDVVFKTAKDIPTFEQRLAEGEYDIAYMNPYHFVVFHDSVGYRALARQIDKRIKGIIVVDANSDIVSLDDLNGKEIAFPSPAAFAATIIPSAYLKQQGILFTPRYVHSHDSVYLNVQRGFFNAGGGIIRTFNGVDDNTRSALRILWESDGYTPHAIATHPRITDTQRDALLTALLTLSEDEDNKQLLKNVGFKGFISSVDEDWDDVRALGITSLARPQL
ncbi:phosphate/phosphite/phosphonate ABC transporter substrate-binding protein [Alteromonas stellipolaris]|jgi:phosphonate transport system substrate-binding protein|uniref:Phosphate/phosphite/phosphonate ABC transporter substrate-binding protein n=2 Tax=Alteromonas stellipolaris TaxID=233316 RepID=A0AAW7Z4V2_9ALTE|nr:phosphate/phosphite/phosphonate ABC transporter substrate-binding protein [Alteromonas stellipolaris]MDO6536096.1 phosphate/phosphite/phosphonate ABC transporter substrate-binding protein [Alteromonas stellipolaris]MDO6540013.1 phosphate/phosphite/phosphonate ABC transporter substrate-binding protein [Alteromonas stellipolaris]MDO6578765.1 phosphate/phosphite/phosphonate ABC transporter substrate-binding protein [Alteromonas stellipolaris]MDO6628004.1 phosphate/phosphite/phosphonate ABC tran